MRIRTAPNPRNQRRKRRGMAWVEVCLILTLLGVMAALAWLGFERETARKSEKSAESAVEP